MSAAWEIRRLEKRHDRSGFDCGKEILNDWLKLRATQFDRKDLSRTYVLTAVDESVVLGYYALSTHRIEYETLSPEGAKGLPRMNVPVVLLGRLAVDRTEQGKGLGAFLLVDALKRSMKISDQIGIRAVEVDALDEEARKFYLKFGFRSLIDDPNHLLMPMHEIRKLAIENES